MKNDAGSLKKIPWKMIGIILLLVFAFILLCATITGNSQSETPLRLRVVFEGDYRIGGDAWQAVSAGEHISATSGDVTLRGVFRIYSPDGEDLGPADAGTPIALLLDHLSLTIREEGHEPFVTDHENPMLGDAACGLTWERYELKNGGLQPVEIVVHNPHWFGNENAVNEMLRNLNVWTGPDFERMLIAAGSNMRTAGMMFFGSAIVVLGVALFSTLLHIKKSNTIWVIGLTLLSASGCFIYSAEGTSFWSERIALNTAILGISMIFYMLFLSGIIAYRLEKTKRICVAGVAALGTACAAALMMPLVSSVRFYDALLLWGCVQAFVACLLIGCLVTEFICMKKPARWMYAVLILPMAAFLLDVAAMAMGGWVGGKASQLAFVLLYIIASVMVWRIIPHNVNVMLRARELETQRTLLEAEKNMIEAELKESRVAIMLSQIRPHFIYNTLGTIERMCIKDPQKAFELVRNFSLYLRGNFSELNSVTPIRLEEEINHVKHYGYIEQTRFPDMEIAYDLQSTDFVVPALSVQPLVENAIKHGLMRLETGGRVIIRAYEDDAHYYVDVIDNGVGFDPELPVDEKKHMGLYNIRGRLSAMVNGELIIRSVPGEGTTATIRIPKEVQTCE